jgi:predicted dehydrogenase
MKRLLVVGAGGIAQRHVSALDRIDAVTIVGVCDTIEERANALAHKAQASAFVDMTQALEEEQPDYVAIMTPRQVREPLIELCLERRLPFFVEKPPCDRLSTGLRLQEKIAAAGTMHSVGFMHRWNEALNTVLTQVREERLSLITIRFQAPFATAPVMDTYPDPYLVGRSGGLVGDQGIHYIDIARYACGSEAETISAVGVNQVLQRSDKITTVDAACWTLTMANGILVNHSHTWGSSRWDCRLHLVSDQSSVTVDVFNNCAFGILAGKEFRCEGTADEFELQHRGFLEALASDEMGLIRSPYADAMKSFQLAAEINRMLYGYTSELDTETTANGPTARCPATR